jgi:hypothetical protein
MDELHPWAIDMLQRSELSANLSMRQQAVAGRYATSDGI